MENKTNITCSGNRVVIVICYYGEFPWYFPFFLQTCRYNPEIDFLIISESTYGKKLPRNVRIEYITFAAIKSLATQYLGFEANIDSNYKLCDFKPLYGVLFSELISEYEFWGYGDIDVIYGNIRGFITDSLLDGHDVITVRHDFIVGYFTLFRNCDKVNTLFMYSRDYKKVLSSSHHYCFDECNFAFWYMDEKQCFEDVMAKCEIESMTHVVKRLHEQGIIKAHFELYAIEGTEGRLKWEKGKLTFRGKYEIMLYHMIKLKKKYSRPHPKGELPESFSISPSRVYFSGR